MNNEILKKINDNLELIVQKMYSELFETVNVWSITRKLGPPYPVERTHLEEYPECCDAEEVKRRAFEITLQEIVEYEQIMEFTEAFKPPRPSIDIIVKLNGQKKVRKSGS